MGLYRLELYDRYGNFLFDISDMVGNRRFTRSRNDYEKMTWTIPLSEFNGLCGDRNKNPREVLKKQATQVILMRGERKMLRTFVLDFDIDLVANSITIEGQGMLSKFDKRRVTDYFEESINPAQAANTLIQDTQALTNGNHWISITTPASAPSRQVTFNDNRISDAILSLANDGDKGFDFEFTPDNEFRTSLNMGSIKINRVLQFGLSNITKFVIHHRGSIMANEITAKGSGSGETEEVIRATVSDSEGQAGVGLLQKTITPNDVTEIDTLQRHAISELEVIKDGLEIPEFTVKSDRAINLDTIDLGDTFKMVVPGRGIEALNTNVRADKFEVVLGQQDEEEVTYYVSE